MKRALLFCCIISLLGSWSCTEDPPAPDPEPRLPPITQTGENTFGCLVDGELWLPKGNIQNPALTASYYNNCVLISATRVGQNPHTYLHLDFGNVFSDTVFSIYNYSDTTGYQYFAYTEGYYSPTVINDYFPIVVNSGELTLLKLDTINRIIAGTFEFQAVDVINGQSVSIEDGRFDLHY